MTVFRVAPLVARRCLASPSLTLFRLLGTVVAVTLVCGVSIYSTTMGDQMLQASLNTGDNLIQVTAAVPVGRSATESGYTQLNTYLHQRAARDLQLPLRGVQTHHFSVTMPIYPWGQTVNWNTQPLGSADLEYYDGFAHQVRMVAGRFPATGALNGGAIAVVVSRASAQSLHLSLGQSVKLLPTTATVTPVRLVIAGIYTVINPHSPFWDVSPALFDTNAIIVAHLAAYLALASAYQAVHSEFNWLLHVDTAHIQLQNIDQQLAAINRFRGNVADFLPGTSVLMSLDTSLWQFRASFALVPLSLYALALPVIGIVLYYIMVATELVMEQQADEVVLMRSRGASTWQIGRIFAVEALFFAALGTLAGSFLALPVARAIGATSGFLTFGSVGAFPVQVQWQTFLIGAAAALLAALAGLLTALRAVRRTMVSYKQEQARAYRRPFWQRLYLDLVLVALALYGYWAITQQGPVSTGNQQAAIVQDPWPILAPTAFVVGGILLCARLLPPLAALLSALAIRSVPALLLALLGINRMPHQHVRLMSLLSLTLAVGVFVAAVAGTIGGAALDGTAFRTGSSLRLIEYDPAINNFRTLSPAWHERQPGVVAASPALRLESYQASLPAEGTIGPGQILAIDPATIGKVIWFRADFSSQPLHTLLDRLQANPDGIIVSSAFLNASGSHVGDSTTIAAMGQEAQFTIVGSVRYFPTLDPPSGSFGLINLSTALAQGQGMVSGPSEMWLRLDDNRRAGAVVAAVRRTGRQVISYQDSAPAPLTWLNNPLRVGLYGVVSIGFVIAAGLSMLSFFVYAYLSMLRRGTEFAVLRALGMTPLQTASIIMAEQILMMVLGTASALAVGLLASKLFIPYLPLTDTPIPPLRLEIPWLAVWSLVGIVALALVPTLAGLTWLLGHFQVARVLGLGEA